MKRLIISLLCVILCGIYAKADIGDWTIYAAYHNATMTAYIGSKIYVLATDGLFSYDIEDESIATYDKAGLLSDNEIAYILPCEATNELVIVYSNGNIDLLSSKGSCYNMPDLKMKTGIDKTMNEVRIIDDMLCICTSTGIVTIDIKKRLFGDYYNIGMNILSLVKFEGAYYFANTTGIYKGDPSSNLLDASSWTRIKSWAFNKLFNLDDKLLGRSYSTYYFLGESEASLSLSRITTNSSSYLQTIDNEIYIYGDNPCKISSDGSLTELSGMEGIIYQAIKSKIAYCACGTEGLKAYKINDDEYSLVKGSIIPNSPLYNQAYHLLIDDDRLFVTGGAFLYPIVKYSGMIMRYEGGKWIAFDEEAPKAASNNSYYHNVTDIVVDPNDSEHFFASSAAVGLFEFEGTEMKALYNHDNSPIESILPTDDFAFYYNRVTGLAYDSDDNLWMLNNECDTIIRRLKADGSWDAIYVSEISGYPTFDYTYFDQRGWAWINSRRAVGSYQAGLLVVDPKNSNRYKFISSFTNQNGTSYSPTYMYQVKEDLDGALWIGCQSGLFVCYEPEEIFDNSTASFTQIVVPRDDGTGLGDYLLSDVHCWCIAVDGGNRKWIGTTDEGAYLISADGLEILEHFTSSNSSLLSNTIYDIAIDGKSGEIFFATGAGLCSYMADATEAQAELDKSNILVYPNPVRPDYNSVVMITGLAYDTDIKIVNAAGKLVKTGTSIGGSFSFYANDLKAGIYYVLCKESNNNSSAVGKFLVIK